MEALEAVAAVLMAVFVVALIPYVIIGLVFGLRRYARKYRVSCFDNNEGILSVLFWGMLWPMVFFSESYRNPPLCTELEHVFRRQEARREAERYHEALQEEQG